MSKVWLIEETWVSDDQVDISEGINEDTGESVAFITCPFQAAGIRNKNGRVYPPKIWERIVDENSNIQELIKVRGFHGMLGHPKDGQGDDGEVTHTVTKLWMREDGVVMGTLQVNNTPRGKIIQEYRKQKYQFGISSRGLGSVASDGTVQEDYELRAFDIVLNPSTPGATVKPVKVVKSQTEDADAEKPAQTVSEPDPVPVAVVEDRADPPTAATTNSGKSKEVSSVMDHIQKFQMLESQARPLLKLAESDFSKKHEVESAQREILKISGDVSELDESVRVQRDSLVKRLDDKRVAMDEWNVGGRLAGSTDAAVKDDDGNVDEAAELKKKLEEAEAKLEEAEKEAKAATELAEAIKEQNDKLNEELKTAVEEREAAENYLAASVEIIGAMTAVIEGSEMEEAVAAAVTAEPRLEEFRSLLTRCESRKELDETVTRLTEAFGDKKSTPPRKTALPPKGGKTKTPDEIGEKVVDGRGESGESGEPDSLVEHGANIFKTMSSRDRVLKEARDSRNKTQGQLDE